MKYLTTTHQYKGISLRTVQRKTFNDLCAALKHSEKMVRKHGNIIRQNWGTRGGDFPHDYRQAVVTVVD